MKHQYEDRTRYFLPRRTWTIIRIDGKAFHTFTKRIDKPFDWRITSAMNLASIEICTQAQGAAFAYIQSDEVSILLTDFARPQTDAWFDGNIQKIASVSASVFTAAFAREWHELVVSRTGQLNGLVDYPAFDARVFVIPDDVEVENYFIWRQQDCVRNSISSLAQAHFSHKELLGKSCSKMQDMLIAIGVNWNHLEDGQKRGRVVYKKTADEDIDLSRPTWVAESSFDFLKDRIRLRSLIPTERQ